MTRLKGYKRNRIPNRVAILATVLLCVAAMTSFQEDAVEVHPPFTAQLTDTSEAELEPAGKNGRKFDVLFLLFK